MKKWEKLLLVSGLALCLGMVAKANTQAAGQVTGVRQIGDSRSSIEVECDGVLGAEYYFLELSADGGKSWTEVDTASSPKLNAYSLNAGRSYQARVGLCEDWSGEKKVAGSESAAVEVVTAPEGSVTAVQSDAKTNGISVKCNAVAGANCYLLYCDKVPLGQSATTTISSNVKLNAGTSYWCSVYAGRKSANYVAVGSYDYENFKTLAPAFNTKSFGLTQTWFNINSYNFSASSAYARDGVQFQFLTPGGKEKKNVYQDGSSGTTSTSVDKFINGYFYKYRVRPYVMCGTRRVFGSWSGCKYIGVAKKVSTKFNKKKKYVTLSISKVSNASSFTVYASTKANSGFKKVKTVSAKKRSVTVKKVAGKKLKRNKVYYFKIVANGKVGKKTVKSEYASVYNWKYYRVF